MTLSCRESRLLDAATKLLQQPSYVMDWQELAEAVAAYNEPAAGESPDGSTPARNVSHDDGSAQ